MKSFDAEMKKRIVSDEKDFERSFYELSSVVMGEASLLRRMKASEKSRSAIVEVLNYFRLPVGEVPEGMTSLDDQLKYLLRPAGVMKRAVQLSGAWWQDSVSVMLAVTRQGEAVALLPSKGQGYTFKHPVTGKRERVSAENACFFEKECYCLYRPLPEKSLTVRDLAGYMVHSLSSADFLFAAGISLLTAVIGMIMPFINRIVFSHTIPYNLPENLMPIFVVVVGAAVSTLLIRVAQGLCVCKIQTRLAVDVQSAAMQRLLMMPTGFFKDYTAGDLSYRMDAFNNLVSTLVNSVFVSGLTALFSFVYLGQIAGITPELVRPTVVTLGVSLAITVLTVLTQTMLMRRIMESSSRLNGLVYSLFSGIQKIKLAGAERRAFTRWAQAYKDLARHKYDPPQIVKVLPVLSVGVTILGSMLIYRAAGHSGVSEADFMAFSSAYGMLGGAIMALGKIIKNLVSIAPTLELIAPLLAAVPESAGSKRQVTSLAGEIELKNITFRYHPDSPIILDNISLKIEPGQYVGIVGETGCGKSTLLRLLMGFETPEVGAVYYDGINIDTVDIRSLRSQIGVVTQDGRLFSGSIYSNIVISAPGLSEDEAWEAAETAGIARDIEAMPMGMNTRISEGDSNISGGQKQRLMIARALAPKPSVIMLDEATSALDNITQKQVSEAIGRLNTTRIVIAHRLSTIRDCDRILMLEGGRIVEDGTFDGLIEKDGAFAGLLKRQML